MLSRVGLVALLLLASSTASASWAAFGGAEPSTREDDEGWMFDDPGLGPGQARVYFQAFLAVEGTSVNPNVATLRSQVLAPGTVHHRALLGYWRDCNEDGFIGLAEGAVQDYHALTPHNGTLCPVGSTHNDGRWISEMIGIGMVDPCETGTEEERAECPGVERFLANERALYATGTMVWGDVGAPGDVPEGECPLTPLPRGTTSGTGRLLQYVDCQIDRTIATTVNDLDRDGSLGLRFEDPEHPEGSSSDLNVPFPASPFRSEQSPGLLQEESGARAATAWDCDDPRAFRVTDPTGGGLSKVVLEDPTGRLTGPQAPLPVVGSLTFFADEDGDARTPGTLTVALAEEGDMVWAPRPAASLDQPAGSWWDALEHAADGPRGDCDGKSAARPAAPAPMIEGDSAQVDAGHKDRASLVFLWYDGHRGLNEDHDEILLGESAPADGGLWAMRHGRGGDGPLWSAEVASANEPQLVSRGTLEPTGKKMWTYYAKIGDDAIEAGFLLPKGPTTTGYYGSEACGTTTIGVLNGWVCDPALWWRDALGRSARPRYAEGMPYAPVPGESYHLRDVDCYDGHVVLGVYASLAPQAGSFCATAQEG